MRYDPSKRRFLALVGQGTLLATLGPAMSRELGFAAPFYEEARKPLHFGNLESLVCFMQETPMNGFQAGLINKLKQGESLKNLVAAAALANARTFGGEDYIGFHSFMALAPALKMASAMPKEQSPLPVLKVLYRNSQRIHEFGGRSAEVLNEVGALESSDGSNGSNTLRDQVTSRDVRRAEAVLAKLVNESPLHAMDALMPLVQDNPEVHRVVLPFRAWDMQNILGTEHATTLLRQSLRYCVRSEVGRRPDWDEHSRMLAALLDQHHLVGRKLGSSQPDDAWVEQLAMTFTKASPMDAAGAAAAALYEGYPISAIGEAISLAATHIVLMDTGRQPQWEDRLKPAGSVHGDSRGVHASDAAHAWRNLANVLEGNTAVSCLLIGAWQVARDRGQPSEQLRAALPAKHHLDRIRETEPDGLLKALDQAIQDNLQGHACAIAQRYGQLGLPAERIFQTLLQYAVSEDGALHAEKYFNTVWDDFHATRPSLRWRHVCSLARVTASEFGKPAAGQAEARRLVADNV